MYFCRSGDCAIHMSEETEKELFCKNCQDKTPHKWDGEKWVCEYCSDYAFTEAETDDDENTIAEEEFDA